MNLASAQSDSSIDFSKTNDGLGSVYNRSTSTFDIVGTKIDNSNGQGLYYTSDLTKTEGGERVYYYRGAVENNYVVFAGYCWRIVRTNEDGSIKLRYGGEPTGTSGNYTCPQTGTDVGINDQQIVPYNQTYGDNTYVGYMMGLDNQCANTTSCSGTARSTSTNAQANTFDSNIKSVIDAWYRDNIVTQGYGITSKIANSIYCNDRSLYSGTGIGTADTFYGASGRLSNTSLWSSTNASPQYICPNVSRDGFTLSVTNGGTTGYGNNKLTYPVGLLTPDEVSYAGGAFGTTNSTYYLYTSQVYWTMGPFFWYSDYASARQFVVYAAGHFANVLINTPGTIIPAISLNSSTLVTNGTGTYNSPYEIE